MMYIKYSKECNMKKILLTLMFLVSATLAHAGKELDPKEWNEIPYRPTEVYCTKPEIGFNFMKENDYVARFVNEESQIKNMFNIVFQSTNGNDIVIVDVNGESFCMAMQLAGVKSVKTPDASPSEKKAKPNRNLTNPNQKQIDIDASF